MKSFARKANVSLLFYCVIVVIVTVCRVVFVVIVAAALGVHVFVVIIGIQVVAVVGDVIDFVHCCYRRQLCYGFHV